jgi:hypothetical protein
MENDIIVKDMMPNVLKDNILNDIRIINFAHEVHKKYNHKIIIYDIQKSPYNFFNDVLGSSAISKDYLISYLNYNELVKLNPVIIKYVFIHELLHTILSVENYPATRTIINNKDSGYKDVCNLGTELCEQYYI